MKKNIVAILIAVSVLLTGTVANAATTNNSTEKITPQERILKDFTKGFASTPTLTILDDGFMADAVVDGHKVSVFYNEKGRRMYSIVRYASSNLDKDILETVKPGYYDYFITSMEKIQQPGFDAIYLVHMVNDTSIKTVKVTGNETELIQSFRKI